MPRSSRTPRRRRYEGLRDARFLTFSCYRNLPLLEAAEDRDLLAQQLIYRCNKEERPLFAWVLMPNHVHLLLGHAEASTVSAFLHRLKSRFARTLLDRWKTSADPRLLSITAPTGRLIFWQPGGGYDRNIHSEAEMTEKCLYIAHNPVRAGLATTPEAWRWSSAGRPDS